MNEKGLEREVLEKYRNIAVVGISDKPDRDSYKVANYLKNHGYNIIPINPTLEKWENLHSYGSLKEAARENDIEVVDIFRKSESVLPIVEEAVEFMPKVIWMQIGVINQRAVELAEEHSIKVIMDKCMMEEHRKL